MLLNFKSFVNLDMIINTLCKLPVHFFFKKIIMFNFQLCKTITFLWSLCAFQMTAFCIPFPNKHFCLCWNPRCKLPVSKIFEKGDCQPGTKLYRWGKAKERPGTMSRSLIRTYHLDSLSLGLQIHKQCILWEQKNRVGWTENGAGTKIQLRKY